MRPRVLVFSTLLPLPVDRGDRNRLFHVLRLLATMGDVRLVAVARAWEPHVQDTSTLAPVEVRAIEVSAPEVIACGALSTATGRPYLVTRYALPRVRRFVARQVDDFRPDVFWGFQAPAFPFLDLADGQRRVIDLVDSPSRYASMLRGSPNVSWAARLTGAIQWRLSQHERRAIARCHVALVNSTLDRLYLGGLGADAATIGVLENCVPRSMMDHAWQPDPARLPGLLFVGNLAYVPNVAAVRELVTQILPRVRARVPEAHLTICGPRGEALARELGQRPGVRFLGFVDDLVPLYRGASVMVVPVPIAGGTQYKLLESLAIGLPSVTSRASAEVTGVTDGREILVADSADEFAEGVLRVLRDAECARSLSANARRFVAAHHTWEGKRDIVARAVGAGP